MTDALGAGTGSFVRRTVAPGRDRPRVGIVWLDRLSPVGGSGGHPAHGSDSVVVGSAAVASGRGETGGETVGTTVEVPPGYVVVDVRVGYATAADAFVAELRVIDLEGGGKSALVVLERCDGGAGDGQDRATVFLDTRTAPTGERTFLTVEASLADRSDRVAVRGVRLNLTRV